MTTMSQAGTPVGNKSPADEAERAQHSLDEDDQQQESEDFAEGDALLQVYNSQDPRLDRQAVTECERRLRICVKATESAGQGPSASDVLSFDIEESFAKVAVYKNHSLNHSTLVHVALLRPGFREDNTRLLWSVLEQKADVHATARYKNPDGTQTECEAVHMAASLGSVAALQLLLEYAELACEATAPAGEDSGFDKAGFVQRWATIQPAGDRFYQPIHDAAFGRKKASILWLLNHNADAGCVNRSGQTPLHLLASFGLMDDNAGDVEQVVRALLERDAGMSSLEAKVSNSHHDRKLAGRIPLELAAQEGSQFPKDHIYLLAPSHWDTATEPRFFKDVLLLAQTNNCHTAEVLARRICEKASQNSLAGARVRRRVRQESQQQFLGSAGGMSNADGSTNEAKSSEVLALLFFLAPRAAVDLMDILVARPSVQDAAKHPLPSRASMNAGRQVPFLSSGSMVPMQCTYHADAMRMGGLFRPLWKFDAEKLQEDQPEIAWHDDFIPNCSQLPSREDHIYPVNTRVLLWPNILDLEICMALTRTWDRDNYIFARLPVQAIAYCLWNNFCALHFQVFLFYRLLELSAMVIWGMSGHGLQRNPPFCPRCWSIILASVIRESINRTSSLVACYRRWTEHRTRNSPLSSMWSPTLVFHEQSVDVASCFLRLWLLWDVRVMGTSIISLVKDADRTDDNVAEDDEKLMESGISDYDQALLALNVLVLGFRLVHSLRLVDGIGKGILAIFTTFFRGTIQQMLLICVMIFANFSLAFCVLVRDQDMSWIMLYLYRGLTFGDGDGLNNLGLDPVRNHDYASIDLFGLSFNANRFLMLAGTFFFNIIVLNLIIAIYGNEYEKIEGTTHLLFLKQRLKYSCDVLSAHKDILVATPVRCRKLLWTLALPSLFGAASVLLYGGEFRKLHQASSTFADAYAGAGDTGRRLGFLDGGNGDNTSSAYSATHDWAASDGSAVAVDNRTSMPSIWLSDGSPSPHGALAAACFIAAGQLLFQALVIVYSRAEVHEGSEDSAPKFLWVCHRSDFDPKFFDNQDVTKADVRALSDDLLSRVQHLDRSIESVGARLDARIDTMLEAMQRIAASCESGKPKATEQPSGSKNT
ncbi:unnamed protein product [Polarella glacialis]|uniref:Uncharacterized protein n=1 Tax=Polarella glacialis TaxID=89957 RepID=A0A813HM41_POLGL|nr:unnamed protein product [Polarella glacialis]